MRRWVAAAALLLLASPVPVRAEGQIWATASVTASLARRWRLNVEVQPRWERDVSEYTQTVARVQVGYTLPKTAIVWGGVEYHAPAGPTARAERRIWQAVTWAAHEGGWALGQRARLEERWLDGAPSLVLRARYQLRATHPLGRSPWGVIGVGELYVTVRGTRLGPSQGLDRGRLGAGMSRRLLPELAIEAGYFREYINRPAPLASQINNVLVANLAMRFPASIRARPAD